MHESPVIYLSDEAKKGSGKCCSGTAGSNSKKGASELGWFFGLQRFLNGQTSNCRREPAFTLADKRTRKKGS